MSYRTTPTGRYTRGWERRKTHQGKKNDIHRREQKVTVYEEEEAHVL
jgi:hypothetical protein